MIGKEMFDKIIFSSNDQMSLAVSIINSGYGQIIPNEQADVDLFNAYNVKRIRDRLLYQFFSVFFVIIKNNYRSIYRLKETKRCIAD